MEPLVLNNDNIKLAVAVYLHKDLYPRNIKLFYFNLHVELDLFEDMYEYEPDDLERESLLTEEQESFISNILTHIVQDINNFGNIKYWDVSNVTNMSNLFRMDLDMPRDLKRLAGIENWDVSHVTDMSKMFSGCKTFNQPLNKWKVSHVTDMSQMFYECEEFNQPLNKWDVSNVTDMHGMFLNCERFNQPLDKWDVSNVTNMEGMFYGAWSFNQPLNMWNVTNVKNIVIGMFDRNTLIPPNKRASIQNYKKYMDLQSVKHATKDSIFSRTNVKLPRDTTGDIFQFVLPGDGDVNERDFAKKADEIGYKISNIYDTRRERERQKELAQMANEDVRIPTPIRTRSNSRRSRSRSRSRRSNSIGGKRKSKKCSH